MTCNRAFMALTIAVLFFAVAGCSEPKPGTVLDEAMIAKRTAESFPAAEDDYFSDMDGGYKRNTDPNMMLNVNEVRGRNTWIVWTGGNDRFWDFMANNTFGAFDLLKILSSHPKVGYCEDPDGKPYEYSEYSELSRDDCVSKGLKWFAPARRNRFYWYGLVNEPCFEKAAGPDPTGTACGSTSASRIAGPIRSRTSTNIPASRSARAARPCRSARSTATAPASSGFGCSRIPDFDEPAAREWDPSASTTTRTYYQRQDLVRPYRVGMSCGFCHVGPSPTHPPADPENPKWENLNSTVGAQYFWIDRIFTWEADRRSNFIFQLLHTSQPRRARHVAGLDRQHQQSAHDERRLRRLARALPTPRVGARRLLAGGELDNRQFNDFATAAVPTSTATPC